MNPSVDELLNRINRLEDEKKVRYCMNQYMHLCDDLDAGFELNTLMCLFSEDAVWEGKGSRYAKTFGRYEGKKSIESMFSKYVKPQAHFELNIHVLGNEIIDVNDSAAQGSWVLVQPSSFTTGKSQLSCARITASFKKENDEWLISHFQTENLFSRPMASAWNNSADLPVPK